jgi:hypothetical protein
MHVTQLAHGQIHMSDELRVELMTPDGRPSQRTSPGAAAEEPPRIRIIWPGRTTITTPAKFDQAVANAMKVLSNAVVELAALRVHRRL